MLEAELDEVLARSRYARRAKPAVDDPEDAAATAHRHGHRSRSLLGTFGKVEISVPRARLNTADGRTTEWKSQVLRTYQRRTLAADALIASCYLAGTNTRRVKRAGHSVCRRGQQGHGEPGLAQGEERLGRLECPLTGCGTDRATDSRRHRGAGAAGARSSTTSSGAACGGPSS
jgi:Transposase, Mutator family